MGGSQRIREWRKGIFLFALCVVAICFPVHVQAAETEQEVTIYGLNSSYLEKLSIPDNLPQSYQLNIGDGTNVTYSISSGSSAKVSADGLITPRYTYWKRYSGYSVSTSEEDYDYYTISAGDTKIIAKTATQSYTITVHVENYAVTYGDKIMDAYLAENITDDMSDKEIMEAIARFPASYDYSASYSGVYSMIIYGGGDCWASTDAIITLCEKKGIKAWSRNGNKDLGAGSGHKNAMAELNGTYYELEAGYSSSKTNGYRPYNVTVRTTLFSYYSSTNGLTIYQYDGYDTSGVLEIPETINGKEVAGLYNSALAGTNFSKILLPETLKSIGNYAFSGCRNLTSMTIPASVTSIGTSIFCDCNNLTNISIASGNTGYKVVNQVIYSKDGTTLVTCPTASKVTIPDTVTEIADYAFYYNANLQSITIPVSVVEMGEGAFGNCSKLSSVTIEGNGLTKIGTHCFRSNSSLTKIKIPASVKSLGAYAFGYCNKLKNIYFMGDAPEFGETINGTYYDQVFCSCTANVYYLKGNTTWTQEVLTNHGGTITWSMWNGIEITTDEDSTSKDNIEETKDGNKANTNEESDASDVGENAQYYDKKTGITIAITGNDKKNATLISVDKKNAKGSFTIPNTIKVDGVAYNITAIAKNAFKNNKKITKVTIGSNMKTIGANAFYGCKNLKTVKLGKNVTTIGDKAFYNCGKITSITIPSKVSKIGKQAFYKCKKLKKINIKTTKLTKKKVGSNAFKGIYSKATIKVPKKKWKVYKSMLRARGVSSKAKVQK